MTTVRSALVISERISLKLSQKHLLMPKNYHLAKFRPEILKVNDQTSHLLGCMEQNFSFLLAIFIEH
jgi:hypothetical protein